MKQYNRPILDFDCTIQGCTAASHKRSLKGVARLSLQVL